MNGYVSIGLAILIILIVGFSPAWLAYYFDARTPLVLLGFIVSIPLCIYLMDKILK